MLFDNIENKNAEGKVVATFDYDKAYQMRTDGHTYNEIAEFFDTEVETVKRHLWGKFPEDKAIDDFKKNLPTELRKKQKVILDSITTESIASAPLKDKAMAFGILFDKTRLEENKSTENVAHNYSDMVERIHEKRAKHRVIDVEVPKQP